MNDLIVNHNNLPEAVEAIYKELIDTRKLLSEVIQKFDSYSSAPKLPEDFENLMTIKEVCDFLGVKANTIHRWKRNKSIPFQKIGTKTYFNKSDVLNYNKTEVKKPKGLRR